MKIENLLEEKAKEDGIEKIVVGGVITNKQNEVLILRRKADDFLGGIDELPSGKLETGETIFEGLIREIKEETNLDVENICSYIDFFDYLSGSGKKSRQYNFWVKVKSYDNIKLTEHDEFKWLSLKDCYEDKNITPKTMTTIYICGFNYLSKQ